MQSASNKVYAKLSKAERNALESYTQGGYIDINNNSINGLNDPRIVSLQTSLKRFSLDQNITVFRGESMRYYVGLSEGDVYQPSMFFSTSIDKAHAQMFQKNKQMQYGDGVLLEIKVPKRSECLYIGRNTDYAENEKELLLSNKLKYKVISIKKTKIILEVIGKNDK